MSNKKHFNEAVKYLNSNEADLLREILRLELRGEHVKAPAFINLDLTCTFLFSRKNWHCQKILIDKESKDVKFDGKYTL